MLRRRRRSTPDGLVSGTDLLEGLQSLYPALSASPEKESEEPISPQELGRRVVMAALTHPDVVASAEWPDLMIFVEALIDNREAIEPPWNDLATSLLEDLLNAVSHGDLPLDRGQVDASLLPRSKEAAAHFDRIWVSQPDDVGADVMDIATYETIQSPELRWLVRCSFRRTPSGEYVGIADILRREARTGRPGGLSE